MNLGCGNGIRGGSRECIDKGGCFGLSRSTIQSPVWMHRPAPTTGNFGFSWLLLYSLRIGMELGC